MRKLMFWSRDRNTDRVDTARRLVVENIPSPITEKDRAEREAFRMELHLKMERADQAVDRAMQEAGAALRYNGPERRKRPR